MRIPAAISTDFGFSCQSQHLRQSIRNVVLAALAVLAIDATIGFVRGAALCQPTRAMHAPTPIACRVCSMRIPAAISTDFSFSCQSQRLRQSIRNVVLAALAVLAIDATIGFVRG